MADTNNTNNVNCENNIGRYRDRFRRAVSQAADVIGFKAETYAKAAAPNWEGILRNSISHMVQTEGNNLVILIGSPLEIAAYAEVGTTTLYEPPADFIENLVPEGKHQYGRRGISEWWYFDDVEHKFKRGHAEHANHFLQNAVTDHADEYARDFEEVLRNSSL